MSSYNNMSSHLPDPAVWAEVEPYLDRALEMEADAREEWLAELAATRPDTARTLRTLLEEREALNSAGFLDAPLLATNDRLDPALHASLERERIERLQAFDLSPDKVIGPYRLIREIRYGGMSSVWLAQHSDGGIKREVALKLPLTQQRFHIERFMRERDILAALTHPNIARLYDAGITETGQPYLAMEYVDGTAITEACDAQRVSVRERLRLFMQVLEAVQFAHARLIIHRDLKPSNILVTRDGRVVLVDFGIGKLLDDGAQVTHLTQVNGRPLTPHYASPEQILGESLGTASDVYSLGVVLYELLTGAGPYRPKHTSRAALEAAVLIGDLRPPSQSEPTAQAAAARKSSVRALTRTLAGDLDTIALKALKRDPAARYAAASAFASDIDDHLHSLPISARPDSFWYRSTRFVSRNKGPVATATVIAMTLVGGISVTLWQAAKAAAERDRASAMPARNEATNTFLSTLITEAAASATPVSVSEMLARSERIATADTGVSAENRAAVLSMIGSYYFTLGDVTRAEELQRRALSLLVHSEDADQRARIVCTHARVIAFLGRHAEAVAARQIDNAASSPITAAGCLINRASIAKQAGDAAGSLRYAQLALERFHEADSRSTVDEGVLLGTVATSLQLNGRNAEAREYFERALERQRAAGRDRDLPMLTLRNDWASLEAASGNPRGALKLYDELLHILAERDANARPPPVLVQNRGRMLQFIGRYDEAHCLRSGAASRHGGRQPRDSQCHPGQPGTGRW